MACFFLKALSLSLSLSNPNSCGYSFDRLRIILFGNKERTNGLALDGTVLIMREWDQLESKHIDVPHVIGYVSEVQERESALVDHGRGTAQRKLGECTIRKISKTGLNQLSLTVPEPKSIIT